MAKKKERGNSEQAVMSALFKVYLGNLAYFVMEHCIHPDGCYHGVDGCHKLAIECGYSMLAFWKKEPGSEDGEFRGIDPETLLRSTYRGLCIIAYGLNPPVDADTWNEWVREGLEEGKKLMELENEETKEDSEDEPEQEHAGSD